METADQNFKALGLAASSDQIIEISTASKTVLDDGKEHEFDYKNLSAVRAEISAAGVPADEIEKMSLTPTLFLGNTNVVA